ncbi:MAG TPA: MoaD/ThiS family protein [Pyrinomonadaceae bacterium]|nr:MoaD/ThiS family protein [Pyrinomonadaceae bacterium]
MRVNILFFGATADAVGSRGLELSVDEKATAKSIIDELSQQHPTLAKHQLLIAVNEEYADADTLLNHGDELALFTAVSGG